VTRQTGVVVTLGQTRSGDSAGVRWKAAAARPAACLGGLVTRYCGFHEQSSRPVSRRELPAPKLVLLVSLDEPLSLSRRSAGSGPSLSQAAVVGVGREGVVAAHTGGQTVLEVELSPLAVTSLFGVASVELTGQVVDLADLWPKAPELVERLHAAKTWAGRFDLIEESLIARVEHGRQADPVLAGAWRQVLHSHGDLSMHALHTQTGWSRGRLAQRFRTEIGLPPKAMAGLVRFDHAVNLLRRPGLPSLAAVALTCGYYDQAHLNREFAQLAGCTPTAFLAGLDTDAAGTAMGGS
jgi:AraC-like DNA-binding protein